MRGKIPDNAGGITATINRAILVFAFAALPFSDAAARQTLTITNGIYEARLQIAVTGTAGLRVIGRLQNRTTTKLQFRTIAVSYACPDGSRHNSQVSLDHLMPEVESDRRRWLPAGAAISIDVAADTFACGWNRDAGRAHAPSDPLISQDGLPFTTPGLSETRVACGPRQVGIVLDLGADGRVFRVLTTDNTRITVGPDSFLARDAEARVRQLICGASADASAGNIHAGILVFMRRWAEFCKAGNATCQAAFENAFRRSAGGSRG